MNDPFSDIQRRRTATEDMYHLHIIPKTCRKFSTTSAYQQQSTPNANESDRWSIGQCVTAASQRHIGKILSNQ